MYFSNTCRKLQSISIKKDSEPNLLCRQTLGAWHCNEKNFTLFDFILLAPLTIGSSRMLQSSQLVLRFLSTAQSNHGDDGREEQPIFRGFPSVETEKGPQQKRTSGQVDQQGPWGSSGHSPASTTPRDSDTTASNSQWGLSASESDVTGSDSSSDSSWSGQSVVSAAGHIPGAGSRQQVAQVVGGKRPQHLACLHYQSAATSVRADSSGNEGVIQPTI